MLVFGLHIIFTNRKWKKVSLYGIELSHCHGNYFENLQKLNGIIQRTNTLKLYTDSHCDRFHSSLTAGHCFNNEYMGKQPVALKEYCTEY